MRSSAINQSWTIPHSKKCVFARASGSEAEQCLLLYYSIVLETRIVMVVLLLIMLTMEVILFILLKNPKFWSGFGAGDDFLGVALVESIDKELIFGVGSSTNR